MCLIVLGWRPGAAPSLIVAANRDEFHRRPSAGLAFWQDAPQVLAGRDLHSGGTWMGVTRTGRFAALTNFRDPASQRTDAPTRGRLVADFLTGDADARGYAAAVVDGAPAFNGFNLLLYDGHALLWVGHGAGQPACCEELAPGIHALSNHRPGTPWPKLLRARQGFAEALELRDAATRRAALFDMLADSEPAPDELLPDTGVGLEWERRLSPVFIAGTEYGTRCSTLLELDATRARVEERTFGAGGRPADTAVVAFQPSPARCPDPSGPGHSALQ